MASKDIRQFVASGRRRTRWMVFGLILVMAFSGCAVHWWYNQLDYLFYRRVNNYFDVTDEQEKFLKTRLAEHLKWHRKEALPRHIAFLTGTRDRIRNGIKAEDVQWFFTAYVQQVDLIVNRLMDDAVVFLKTLSPEQIDHFEAELKDQNEEFQERLEMTPEERAKARTERLVDTIEDWIGSLSSDQKAIITKMSREMPDTFEDWYQDRVKRQKRFVAALRNKSDEGEIRQSLHDLISPENRSNGDAFGNAVTQIILKIDAIATPEQRKHAVAKVQDWIDELQKAYRD